VQVVYVLFCLVALLGYLVMGPDVGMAVGFWPFHWARCHSAWQLDLIHGWELGLGPQSFCSNRGPHKILLFFKNAFLDAKTKTTASQPEPQRDQYLRPVDAHLCRFCISAALLGPC
jgi:hypothetical protein